MMEFSTPKTITAHYKITTPMFLGGEGQQADDRHFRNASFKGALRFWWRALNWGRILQAAQGDKAQALKNLHQQEGELFGLASDGKNSRQSLIQISSTLTCRSNVDNSNLARLGYLLGLGLYRQPDKVLRNFIAPGDLKIQLSIKPQMSDNDVASVRQALIALGLFGGLGSRSRKGLGSLSIQTVQDSQGAEARFTNIVVIQEFIKTIHFADDKNAPFSALTKSSRIDVSVTKRAAMDALLAINNEMQLYRSYGQNGRVNGQQARRNFVADHDNALAATQGEDLNNLPERAVFGLPHNYFFSSTKGKLDINPEKEGRRASPLFIHIHELDNGQFAAIQTLLPGEFLPENTAIDVKAKRTQKLNSFSVNYAVISKYLDGFQERQNLKQGQA